MASGSRLGLVARSGSAVDLYLAHRASDGIEMDAAAREGVIAERETGEASRRSVPGDVRVARHRADDVGREERGAAEVLVDV